MGRLEEKLELEKKLTPQFSRTEVDEQEPTNEEEYYRRQKSILMRQGKRRRKFGFSKNANALAAEIESCPSKEGALKKTFYGRPLDLHMLEDYLVWRTSPLAIKTILRYGHAKTLEDMRGYIGTVERAKGNPKTLMLIVLAAILLVGGIIFLLYGSQLMSMLGGGAGAITGAP